MLLEDINYETRLEIGNYITSIKNAIRIVNEFLYVLDENGDATAEKIEGASDIDSIIKLYSKCESTEYIGEVLFQSDGEPIIKILDMFGIRAE